MDLIRAFIFLCFVILIDGECITSQLSAPRSALTATSVGNMVLFAGGYNDTQGFSLVDIFDTSSNSWTSYALETRKGAMTSTSIVDVAFFNGGTVLDMYNSTSKTWSTTSLSVRRYYEGVASSGTHAIWAGGYTETIASNAVDIFTYSGVGAGTWETATLSVARRGIAATAVGSYFLFAGGLASSTVTTVDIYNTATNEWSVDNLPTPRYTLNGDFYAISAGDVAFFTGSNKEVVDMFNPTTSVWSTVCLTAYK